MANTELQTARSLAHRLYGQCRESPDAYKLLNPSLRKLRNLLEDVEEDAASSGPSSQAYDVRLSEQVARCKDILSRLDVAMQQRRSDPGSRRPSGDAIADLKTALDVTCHQLSVVYETPIGTGVFQLRLETESWSPTASHTPRVASMSATSDVTRKLSTSSSAWSLVYPRSSIDGNTTDAASNATSPVREPTKSSEEKQVCSPMNLTSPAGLTPSQRASSWASTFAFDPLSIPMEEATAFILNDDSPTLSDHSLLSPSLATITSSKLEESDAMARSQAEDLSTTFASPVESSAEIHETPGIDASPYPISSSLSATVEMPDVEEGARDHSLDLVFPHPPQSSTFNRSDPPQSTLDADQRTNNEPRKCQDLSVEDTAGMNSDPSVVSSSPFSNGPRQSVASVEWPRPSTEIIEPEQSTPRPPRRAPPPPPSPRRSRPRNPSISRYTIVNLTPLDDEASDTDEEGLDTLRHNSSFHADITPIPELRVDDSACEEHNTPAITVSLDSETGLEHDDIGSAYPRFTREISLTGSNATTPSPALSEEALLQPILAQEPEAKLPPLPARPRRYHSMHSAPPPPAPAPKTMLDSFISQALVDLDNDNRLQVKKKLNTLKSRHSVGDALNTSSSNEGPTSRWSWQRRLRSRSVLDNTQMPQFHQRQRSNSGLAKLIREDSRSSTDIQPFMKPKATAQELGETEVSAAPQRQRSHSGLARMIREDLHAAASPRPFMSSKPAPPQLLEEGGKPPPVPPRPRLSAQSFRKSSG